MREVVGGKREWRLSPTKGKRCGALALPRSQSPRAGRAGTASVPHPKWRPLTTATRASRSGGHGEWPPLATRAVGGRALALLYSRGVRERTATGRGGNGEWPPMFFWGRRGRPLALPAPAPPLCSARSVSILVHQFGRAGAAAAARITRTSPCRSRTTTTSTTRSGGATFTGRGLS